MKFKNTAQLKLALHLAKKNIGRGMSLPAAIEIASLFGIRAEMADTADKLPAVASAAPEPLLKETCVFCDRPIPPTQADDSRCVFLRELHIAGLEFETFMQLVDLYIDLDSETLRILHEEKEGAAICAKLP